MHFFRDNRSMANNICDNTHDQCGGDRQHNQQIQEQVTQQDRDSQEQVTHHGDSQGNQPYHHTRPCPQYIYNYNYNLSSQSHCLPPMPPQAPPFDHQYTPYIQHGPPHPPWQDFPPVQMSQLSPQRTSNVRQISTPITAGRSNRRRTSDTESVFTRASTLSFHRLHSNLSPPAPPAPIHDPRLPQQAPPIHSNILPPVPIRRQLPSSFDPLQQQQFEPQDFPTLEYATARKSQPSEQILPPQRNRYCKTRTAPSRIAPPTTQATIFSDEQLLDLLNHPHYSSIQIYGHQRDYKLKEARVVEQGLEVGYKYSLNEHELAVCYGPDGVITNHIFSSLKRNDRSENKVERAKRPMRVVEMIYEPSRFVECKAHECEAKGLVVRFNHLPSNTR